MLQSKSFLSSNYFFLLTFPPNPITSLTPFHNSLHKSNSTRRSVSVTKSHAPSSLLAEAPDETVVSGDEITNAPPEEGPIELPSSITDIFATSDDPSPLQTATSLLLTGAISVFLFRSLRRRAKRAKELVKTLVFLLYIVWILLIWFRAVKTTSYNFNLCYDIWLDTKLKECKTCNYFKL